jgi:hypothetical protein
MIYDEDEMLQHDLDHDDEDEMDHHDYEDWQDSDEADDEDSEDDDDLFEMGYAGDSNWEDKDKS